MEKSQRIELPAELEFAMDLAKSAGQMMIANFSQSIKAELKEDSSPVTQADRDINRMVIEKVQQKFPDDGVLGEEASYESDRERLWVVDPIDGTQPFVMGVPISTFCLSLVKEGESVLGVVLDPFQNRLYSAVKGQGASLNGQVLRVSGEVDMLKNQSVILSSRMTRPEFPTTGQLYDKVADARGKVFNFRSIVYGAMLVVTGNAVASVAGYLKPWDLAAAKVILEEAGAKITDLDGQNVRYDQIDRGLLMTNGGVHQLMLDVIKDANTRN